MDKGNGRRACLGLQWDPGGWEVAPLWVETVLRRFPDSRLHWNLPAMDPRMPARRRAALVRPLRARIESSGDVVTALGYAGACHPLLNLDELDKELAWGVRNPWSTGLADVLEARTTVLIPRVADLLRPDAAALYRRHGFTFVGVCREPGGAEPPAASGWLSVVRVGVSERGVELTRRLRRASALPGTLFVLLDLTGASGESYLAEVLDATAAASIRPGLTVLELPASDNHPSPAPAWRPDWAPYTIPGLHARLAAVAGVARRKRKRAEDVQAVLTSLGSCGQGPAPAERPLDEEPRSRRLVAHMLGDVLLAGPDFDVRLSGGRFCGLVHKGRDLVPGFPAVSSITLAGRPRAFRTASSFSFEGDAGTGLREELSLEGSSDAGLSIEYSFHGDAPELSVSGEIRFPRVSETAAVDAYVPIALALRETGKGEPAEIQAEAPDGSAFAAVRPAESSILVLPGARHRVRRADGGWIVLSFGAWGIPSFRIVRHRGRRLLLVNPFGSWLPQPGSALNGRRECFSMLVGLEDA